MRKEWIKYRRDKKMVQMRKRPDFPFFSFFFLWLAWFFFCFLNFSFVIFFHEMEIEDEHEQLKAVRRNCEKLGLLVSSSSSSDEEEEETTTTISNCLRSLRALFSRKKEVSPKECLRVRSFLF